MKKILLKAKNEKAQGSGISELVFHFLSSLKSCWMKNIFSFVHHVSNVNWIVTVTGMNRNHLEFREDKLAKYILFLVFKNPQTLMPNVQKRDY